MFQCNAFDTIISNTVINMLHILKLSEIEIKDDHFCFEHLI